MQTTKPDMIHTTLFTSNIQLVLFFVYPSFVVKKERIYHDTLCSLVHSSRPYTARITYTVHRTGLSIEHLVLASASFFRFVG